MPPPLVRHIVVLSLTKHSEEVENLLLGSTIARSLEEEGIDVKPTWAGGAKVFVRSLEPSDVDVLRVSFGQHIGLGPNHVVLDSNDELKVLAVLKPSPKHRAVATAKLGTTIQAQLEGNDDDFSCSLSPGMISDVDETSDHYDQTVRTEVSVTIEDNEHYQIVVKNTFIQAMAIDRIPHPLRKTLSDPCLNSASRFQELVDQ